MLGRSEQLFDRTIRNSWPPTMDRFSPQYRWRRSLMSSLTKELALSRILSTGSWANGTAIRGHSDWDYFLIRDEDRPDSPAVALEDISTALRYNLEKFVYWEIDRPALCITDPFDGSKLDLIPAYRSTRHEYTISAPAGDSWIASNPTAHIAYIDRADQGNWVVRPLIRLMKSWKYAHSLPISSLYLEMKTSTFVLGGVSQGWLGNFVGVVSSIVRDELRPLQDPSVTKERLLEPLIVDSVSRTGLLKQILSFLEVAQRLDAAERSQARDEVDKYFRELFPTVNRSTRLPLSSRSAHFRTSTKGSFSKKH